MIAGRLLFPASKQTRAIKAELFRQPQHCIRRKSFLACAHIMLVLKTWYMSPKKAAPSDDEEFLPAMPATFGAVITVPSSQLHSDKNLLFA